MPLPGNSVPWPPKALECVTPVMDAWSSWYAGDTAGLERAYGRLSQQQQAVIDRPAQYRGGVVGGIARWFWGAPRGDLTQPKSKLHIPIAADLCQASADLLYAEPPTFTVEDKATQDRLNELAGDGLYTAIAEGAELGAALGTEYLRVTWDRTLQDSPFITSVHADAAWPEFRWGRLVAVTFWYRVAEEGQQVWRHLERHELDGNGVGIVLHGLYLGARDNLGQRVSLTAHASTEGLAKEVDGNGVISTESPGLAVECIRNQGPQRRWRHDPLGANLGRSDLDGVEPEMDALDEVWTSWMRDIRLGKGRVFIGRSLVEQLANGSGSAFDMDQEVFAPLELPPQSGTQSAAAGLPIQAEQFDIRWEEHSRTADKLVEQILRTAGYSSQTFGMDDGGGGASNLTATEVQARERRSYLTRDRKIRLQKPGVSAIVEKLLAVDAAIFSSGVSPQPVTMDFADSVQESAITLAQTVQALEAARAASTDTKVRMLHPDWDDTKVAEEVKAIHAESGAAVASPFDTGAGVDNTVQPA